jgi:hypothetical protein
MDPKNEFREQLEKQRIAEKEIVERDTYAIYLRLKCNKEMRDDDIVHIQSAIDKLNAFANKIFKLPNSGVREGILSEIKQLIKNFVERKKVCEMPLADKLILQVLEEKFSNRNINEKS